MNKLNHIAFIMDGNGRWGKKKRKGRNYGHLKGVETVKKIVIASIKLKIPRPRANLAGCSFESVFENEVIRNMIIENIKIFIINYLILKNTNLKNWNK